MELVEKILTSIDLKDDNNKPLAVDITKFDRTNRADIEQLVKNSHYFYQTPIQYIRDLIVQTIMDYGVDTARNHFLYFVASPRMKELTVAIPYAHGVALQKELQDKELRTVWSNWSKAKAWMFDDRAYQGDIFKLKALILLSDPDEAARFGDLNKRPIEDILNAKSRAEVEQILNNWATKDGSESPSRSHRLRSNAKRFDKDIPDTVEKWIEFIQDMVKKLKEAPDSAIEAAAKKSYKKGEAALAALDDFIKQFTEKDSSVKQKPEQTPNSRPRQNSKPETQKPKS